MYNNLRISFHKTKKLPLTPLDALPPDHGTYSHTAISEIPTNLPRNFFHDGGVMLTMRGKAMFSVTRHMYYLPHVRG